MVGNGSAAYADIECRRGDRHPAQPPQRRPLDSGGEDRPDRRRDGESAMNAPEANLDSRFSEPDALATDWNETRRVLETAELFWICTVRRDGRPHVTPVVAVWLDGAIHFSTGAGEQKAVNLRSNPHVIL